MLYVLLLGTTVDKDVIKKHQHISVQTVPQDRVHDPLERYWCIAQAKGHHEIFVSPISTHEGYLLNIRLSYSDLMVSRVEVQFTEIFGPM